MDTSSAAGKKIVTIEGLSQRIAVTRPKSVDCQAGATVRLPPVRDAHVLRRRHGRRAPWQAKSWAKSGISASAASHYQRVRPRHRAGSRADPSAESFLPSSPTPGWTAGPLFAAKGLAVAVALPAAGLSALSPRPARTGDRPTSTSAPTTPVTLMFGGCEMGAGRHDRPRDDPRRGADGRLQPGDGVVSRRPGRLPT